MCVTNTCRVGLQCTCEKRKQVPGAKHGKHDARQNCFRISLVYKVKI